MRVSTCVQARAHAHVVFFVELSLFSLFFQKCRKFEEGSCAYGNRCFLRHGDGPSPSRLMNGAGLPPRAPVHHLRHNGGGAGMSSPYAIPQDVGSGGGGGANAKQAPTAQAAAAPVPTEVVSIEDNVTEVLQAEKARAVAAAAGNSVARASVAAGRSVSK